MTDNEKKHRQRAWIMVGPPKEIQALARFDLRYRLRLGAYKAMPISSNYFTRRAHRSGAEKQS